MRGGRWLLAALFVVALIGAASALASSGTRITFVTPTLSPGGTLTVKAASVSGARCVADLFPPRLAATVKLGSHVLGSGRGVWTYQLPLNAALGRWSVTVSCTKGGQARGVFKVGPVPIAPAQIQVVKTGFYAETFSFDPTVFLNCGVELKNTSTSDARNLAVTVTFADTQGRSLASTEVDLSLIPAGQTFYFSCLKTSAVTLSVSSVQVQVKVGKSTAHTGELPSVSNLKLTSDQFGVSQTLTGSLTNPYAIAMPQDATIYALYFDAGGNFVGGSSTRAGASVQPGATVSFSFANVGTNVASAEVSVDPCGSAALFGGCQVP